MRQSFRLALTGMLAGGLSLVVLAGCSSEAEPAAQPIEDMREVAPTPSATPVRVSDQREWEILIGDGWKILDSDEGTIRSDTGGGVTKVVAVLVEGTDPKLVKQNDSLGQPELNLNPRRLVMLDQSSFGWRIWADYRDWLPRAGSEDMPCLLDPLAEGGVKIERGTLQIDMQYFYSCGSWYITNETLKFHREGDRLRLVGKETFTLHRATHDAREISSNFLTHRQEIADTSGNVAEDDTSEQPTTKSSRRIPRKKWYFEDLDPEKCWASGENAPAWCDQ